jgi:hypothetical protein
VSPQGLGLRFPQKERGAGTLVFWMKEPQGPAGARFLAGWGPGWVGVTGNSLQNSEMTQFLSPIHFPSVPLGAQWTQFGISWDNKPDEKGVISGRVRIYRNGIRVQEGVGFFSANSMVLGSQWPMPEGKSRLIDNVRLWDRVLADSEVKLIYRRDFQGLTRPLISVPRLKKAPYLNGKVVSQEWAGAARITGLLQAETGETAADQSAFYLGYDDAYLYVAMDGDMTELARTKPAAVYERFLRTEHSGRAEGVMHDDAVELVLSPEYWKVESRATAGAWREYRIIGNSRGGYYSAVYGRDGVDAAWDAKWRTASSVSNEGWQFEARIPLEAFTGAPPAPGDLWGLQLGRIWKELKDEYDLWTWGRRPGGPDDAPQTLHIHEQGGFPLSNFGTMRFAAEDDVAVRVNSIGRPTERQIDFHAELVNPGEKEQQVTAKLFTDTPEVAYEEFLTLPAGGVEKIGWKRQINDFASSRLTFEVLAAGGEVLHRTEVGFYIEQKFEVRLVQYPNYEKFMVALNLGTLSNVPLEGMRVDMRFLEGSTRKPVYEKTGLKISTYSPEIEDSTSALEYEDYTLLVTVRDREKVLASERLPFTKIQKAEWWGNRHGYEDMDNDVVPYPWTDMKVENETVKVWGREYRFGQSLLPEQVTTLDYPILRAPMRLTMKTADGRVLDTSAIDAKSNWTKTNKTRVEATRTIDAEKFSLKNTFWAEYDGLVWCVLTLNPKDKMTVEALEIEIPMNEQFSDVSAFGWIGNGDGGIQIYQEGNTFLLKDKSAVAIERHGGVDTWRMTLVNMPTEFAAPYKMTLGFMATPGRPKTWRTPEYQAWDRRPTLYGFAATGGGPFYPKELTFKPAPDLEGKGHGGNSCYVWTTHVNITPDAVSDDDFKYYVEWLENPFQGGGNLTRGLVQPENLQSRSLHDWFVWRYWCYRENHGLTRLYYDNLHREGLNTREITKRLYNILPISNNEERYFPPDNNPYRSHTVGGAANGYIDLRYMNFWNYHWDGEQLNGVINQWQTYIGHITPESFRKEFMGHNFAWPVMFLGQGRMKQDMADAHGGSELAFDHLAGLALLHDMGGDLNSHATGSVGAAAYRRWYETMDRHSLLHWIYQFLPYWHQDLVQVPDKNMYASWYIAQPSKLVNATDEEIDGYFETYQRRNLPEHMRQRIRREVKEQPNPWRERLEDMKDKAILIFYNHSEWEGVMRLKVDWDKLGFGPPNGLKAENAIHRRGIGIEKVKNEKGGEVEQAVFFDNSKEYAKIENGEIVFPMTKWNYRMIVIEKIK